jgi:hypothetical protein
MDDRPATVWCACQARSTYGVSLAVTGPATGRVITVHLSGTQVVITLAS